MINDLEILVELKWDSMQYRIINILLISISNYISVLSIWNKGIPNYIMGNKEVLLVYTFDLN